MLFEKIKLEDDEQMLITVHRHWFVFLLKILGVVFMALAPFTLYTVARTQEMTANLVGTAYANYSDQILFVSALWLLINWMSLAYIWTDQYLDLWVVTDRRIITIDQRSLFVRNIGSFRLERLQDMSIEIPGFLATFLDYGNIETQTAGHGENEFHAKGLPKPREIKALILEATDNRMKSMSRSEYINELD